MPYLKTRLNPWVVAVACSFSAGMSASYVQSAHLFVQYIREIYGVSYQDASLVPCIGLALLYFGMLANMFFNQFGYRVSIMGGGMLMTVSQLASAFTNDYRIFLLLLGVVNGIGVTICFSGPVMVAGYLFTDKNRHKALAVVYAGVGGGLMVMPMIFELISAYYSFKGTLIIFSGLTLQITVAGATMPDHLIYVVTDRKYSTHSNGSARKSSLKEAFQKRRSLSRSRSVVEKTTAEIYPTKTMYEQFLDTFRPQLLKDWRLQAMNGACFFVAVILAVMSAFNDSMLTVDYGFSNTERTALVAASGFFSMAGRLSVGLIPKMENPPRWWVWCFFGLLEGLSIASLGLLPSTGIPGAAFAECLYGYTLGIMYTLHAVVLGDVFDSEDFAAAYAFNAFVMMVASLVAPVFSGWLGDMTNSFRIPLYIAGFSQLGGFLIPVFLYWVWKGVTASRARTKAKAEHDAHTPFIVHDIQ